MACSNGDDMLYFVAAVSGGPVCERTYADLVFLTGVYLHSDTCAACRAFFSEVASDPEVYTSLVAQNLAFLDLLLQPEDDVQ